MVEKTSKNPTPESYAKPNNWTLMIYHAGDAGLSEEFVWSYKEMLKVGTPEGVAVVALMDSIAPQLWMFTIPPRTPGSQEGSMFADGNAGRARAGSPKKLGLGENRDATGGVNMTSPTLLGNFVLKCIREHPARHYMLILSGHGSGILGNTLLQDASSGRFMSIPSLNQTLGKIVKKASAEGRKQLEGEKDDPRIDILGFDACGMMTAEIAHLLREDVKYIVSGEGFMTLQGWPYHEILRYLNKTPDAEPEALAKETVRRCVRYYSDFARVGQSVDLAACELNGEALNRLTHALRALSERLREDINDGRNRQQVINALIAAHWCAQSYAHEQYVDLYDFCEQLQIAYPDYAKNCEAIIASVKAVVKKSCYAGSGYQNSHGLSLYFPWVATIPDLIRYSYERGHEEEPTKTPFNEATGWGDFLSEFIEKVTRRDARRPNGSAGPPIFMPPSGYFEYIADYRALQRLNDPPRTTATHRDGFPNLARDGFPNIVRDGFPNLVRDGFPNLVRDGFPNIVRDSFPNSARNGQLLGDEAQFKNPALEYFEDECDS